MVRYSSNIFSAIMMTDNVMVEVSQNGIPVYFSDKISYSEF